jgi:hypothetical protein
MQPLMTEAGLGAAALLAGLPAPRPKLAALRWLPPALALIPLLQVASVARTAGLARRWATQPDQRPSRGRVWGLRILPPFIPDLALMALAAWLLRTPLRGFIRLFAPDFTAVALASGAFAAAWGPIRTALLLLASERNRP